MKPVPSSGAGRTLRKYLSSFMHTQKSIYNFNVFDPKTLEHNVTLQCIIFYALQKINDISYSVTLEVITVSCLSQVVQSI